ncbi:MAG TPA: VOC family protein [Planctomycetota bacterium]
MPTPTIVPCLWFADEAEAALRHYSRVFADARVLSETRWGPGAPMPEGSLMVATVRLAGQQLMLLAGNPEPRFGDSVSLAVRCETQAEIDGIWEALSEGGQPGRCGWLKDRFGVSWQVVPATLAGMLGDPDATRARRVAEAMMTMQKLDLARLQRAHEGR